MTEKNRTVRDLMDMGGRVSLITGGAGKIGFAIADALASQGSDLLLLDHDTQALATSSRELRSRNRVKVETSCCDLESEADLAAVPNWVEQNFGKIDVLINNAAFVGTSKLQGWSTDFENQSIASWRRAFDVNLTAPFALAQACYPLLLKSTAASIINIGSIYGSLGPDLSLYEGTAMNNPAAYAASKGGLLQLTRWMATVLAPNIRVNAISPGGVARGQPQSFVDRYVARTPLKRMGREDDFKGAVVYLASEMSSWVTGQNLVVDGGWSCW